ncbi:uncharacterized protein TRIADDRAFT_22406 [Trichoplax adhaerens]|uniref:Proline iminopeptidase n=1 Tax=Trichoplax adhaerens TaxID=10228 RepID=B3RT62_TRIAD|nr:hypothetical protein TRIADDRAFT_22406 [Trichoplax adhaerens]EDV27170.1 hypothetical protein TRIADDRAFT_22406 [Trichoplax adhaerens]|eukprot:XP_002111166.1 hypothetical protein TRIADDRAFT_22406 [Trichoplax adhaerens]
MANSQALPDLYPDIEPYDSGFLKVSDLHTIYYEQCGNASGNPVMFLHGGPGAGTSEHDRRYFDPESYRIIMMDQRGSGKSTPFAELQDNNTWTLVEDIEILRKHLGIEKWVVFGGSWGSTLSLIYTEEYPEHVKALIVRGIFTFRRKEVTWVYQEGASALFPDYFEEFVEPIPEVERGDLIGAYYRRLTGNDEEVKIRCARAWCKWEMAISSLLVDEEIFALLENDYFTLAFARIECHFSVHGGWFKSANHILDNVEKIRHIPGVIVQGRYDVICPVQTARDLHKAWPEAEFHIAPDAGHSEYERGIIGRLIEATDKFRNI